MENKKIYIQVFSLKYTLIFSSFLRTAKIGNSFNTSLINHTYLPKKDFFYVRIKHFVYWYRIIKKGEKNKKAPTQKELGLKNGNDILSHNLMQYHLR